MRCSKPLLKIIAINKNKNYFIITLYFKKKYFRQKKKTSNNISYKSYIIKLVVKLFYKKKIINNKFSNVLLDIIRKYDKIQTEKKIKNSTC